MTKRTYILPHTLPLNWVNGSMTFGAAEINYTGGHAQTEIDCPSGFPRGLPQGYSHWEWDTLFLPKLLLKALRVE